MPGTAPARSGRRTPEARVAAQPMQRDAGDRAAAPRRSRRRRRSRRKRRRLRRLAPRDRCAADGRLRRRRSTPQAIARASRRATGDRDAAANAPATPDRRSRARRSWRTRTAAPYAAPAARATQQVDERRPTSRRRAQSSDAPPTGEPVARPAGSGDARAVDGASGEARRPAAVLRAGARRWRREPAPGLIPQGTIPQGTLPQRVFTPRPADAPRACMRRVPRERRVPRKRSARQRNRVPEAAVRRAAPVPRSRRQQPGGSARAEARPAAAQRPPGEGKMNRPEAPRGRDDERREEKAEKQKLRRASRRARATRYFSSGASTGQTLARIDRDARSPAGGCGRAGTSTRPAGCRRRPSA